ncbi:hypothetical protein CR513_12080, partial [Mucuna pruriens]
MVIRHRLREETGIAKNQFSFMPRESTTKVIYLLWELMERYRSKARDLHMILIDLEETYDQVPREVLWKTMERKGVYVAYIWTIQGMYDGITPSARILGGKTRDFPIGIGLHQGSALKSKEAINFKLELWRQTLETKGFAYVGVRQSICIVILARDMEYDLEVKMGEDVVIPQEFSPGSESLSRQIRQQGSEPASMSSSSLISPELPGDTSSSWLRSKGSESLGLCITDGG